MPTNSVRKTGYLTPDSADYERLCRSFSIPNDARWLGNFMGAIEVLTHEENWRQYGLMTPSEAAVVAQGIFNDGFYGNGACNAVPAPYWQDANGDDLAVAASPETQNWYGRIHHSDPEFTPDLADFVFSAFLVSVGVPNSAVQFIVNLRHASIAYRKGQHGAILRVFLDGVEQPETIDTYSASDDVGQRVYDIIADGAVLWVEHTGEHNPSATPDEDGQYRMDLVRKNLADGVSMFQLRQNPDNSCQMQQTLDGGETWLLAFDYGICVPTATQTILEAVLQNNTYVSPFQPNVTFITQAGYTDAETEKAYQSLCFAATYIVALLCDAVHQERVSGITAENYVETALALATAIVGAIAVAITVPVLGWVAAAGAVVVAVIAFAEAIAATSASIWIDEGNRAALACLLLSNLANAPVTIEAFGQAFANADCLTSDQQTMAGILTQILTYPDQQAQMYSAMLANIAEVNSQAQSDMLDAACGCDAATWSHSFNFCGQLDGWELVTGTVESDGFTGLPFDGWAEIVTFKKTMYVPSAATLDQIMLYYYGASTTYVIFKVNGTEILHVWPMPSNPQGFTSGLTVSGTVEIEFSLILTGAGDLRGQGAILSGVGANPFGGCDTADAPPCWSA